MEKKSKDLMDSLVNRAWEIKVSHGYPEALTLLEEAHLLFQPYGFLHLKVHLKMFKLALEFKEWKEALGQIPRILLAAPGSWLGLAPKGNLGSTKMGMFEKK